MIQDIFPNRLNTNYQILNPKANDFLLVYNDSKVLLNRTNLQLPTVANIEEAYSIGNEQYIYLFAIDEMRFFLSQDKLPETNHLYYHDIRSLRSHKPKWLCFAAATGMHLAHWYENNRFCGKCGSLTVAKEDERAVCCTACDSIVYPRINPVVIVGITDGERLLLGKNMNSAYKHYGLISGFIEIAETVEEAVKRETMEEVGLKVKNIRYYKSQPWAFSESMLMGFFAEVDGNTTPYLDGKELTEAVWINREELPLGDSHVSLTWEMIESFRLHRV